MEIVILDIDKKVIALTKPTMNSLWIIYILVVLYIIVLVVYFLRRSKSHEKELTGFLTTAKQQVELHKKQAAATANIKVAKAMHVVKKVKEAASAFEQQAHEEYNQIISQAKEEKKAILEQAKKEVEEVFLEAEEELEDYRQQRYKEIEKNLVKMVVSVSEKVVESNLSLEQHKQLIYKALEEVKSNKARNE